MFEGSTISCQFGCTFTKLQQSLLHVYIKNGKSSSDFVLFLAAFIRKRKKGPAPKNGVFVVLADPYRVALTKL